MRQIDIAEKLGLHKGHVRHLLSERDSAANGLPAREPQRIATIAGHVAGRKPPAPLPLRAPS